MRTIREYNGYVLLQNVSTGEFEVRSKFTRKLRGKPCNEGHGHNMLRDMARHDRFDSSLVNHSRYFGI